MPSTISKSTFPLHLLTERAVDSLAGLRAQREARAKAGPDLLAAEQFKEHCDTWQSRVSEQDQGPSDYAAHKPGLIVLDGFHPNTKQEVFAEQALGVDGRVESSDIYFEQGGRGDTHLTYSKKDGVETYARFMNGDETKLLLDHNNGTLTFIESKAPDTRWPFPTGHNG